MMSVDPQINLSKFDELLPKWKDMKEQTKVKEIRDNIQDYLDNEYNEDIDLLSDEFKEKLIMAFLEPVLSTISDNLIESRRF